MNTSKNARALRPSKPPMRELFIAYRAALPNKSNLNSGHVAFQWFADGVIYGVSVHGITDVNRRMIRELLDYLVLVGPRS